MATSFLTFAGDGSTTDFVFDQGALEAGHLTATVDDIEVEVIITEQVKRREFLVSFAVAPALATNIRITRNTPVTQRVLHYSSAVFASDTPDESFLHRLYILQEALDNFTDADLVTTDLKDQLQVLVDAMETLISDDQAVTSAAVDAALALYEANIQAALDAITPNVDAATTTATLQTEAQRQCDIEGEINIATKDTADVQADVATLQGTLPYSLGSLSDWRYWPLIASYDSPDGTMFTDYSGNDDHIWMHPDADAAPDVGVKALEAGAITTAASIDADGVPVAGQVSAATGTGFTTPSFTLAFRAHISDLASGGVMFGPLVESNNSGSDSTDLLPAGRLLRHAFTLEEVFTGQLKVSFTSFKADGNGVKRTLNFNGLSSGVPLDIIVVAEVNSATNRLSLTAKVNSTTQSNSWTQLSGFTDLEPGEELYFGIGAHDKTVGQSLFDGAYGHVLYTPDVGIATAIRDSYEPVLRSDVALQSAACTYLGILGEPPVLGPPDVTWPFYSSGGNLTSGTTTLTEVLQNMNSGTFGGSGLEYTSVSAGATQLQYNIAGEFDGTETEFRILIEAEAFAQFGGDRVIVEITYDGSDYGQYAYNLDTTTTIVDQVVSAPGLTLGDILINVAGGTASAADELIANLRALRIQSGIFVLQKPTTFTL